MPYATPAFIEYYVFMRIEIEKFIRQTNGGMIDRNTLIDLIHIFTMDIDKLGQIDASFEGLHWDPNGMWEKSGIFKTFEKEVFPSGAYKLKIEWNGKEYTKTFFPQHWSIRDTFDAIKDVYNQNTNILSQVFNGQTTKHRINGMSKHINMRAIITKKQLKNIFKIITSFPNI